MKKRAAQPSPQLVFPFDLRVGDVILGDGAEAEVVGRPTSAGGGKMTSARIQRVKIEMLWENWRKVRVVRRAA